MASRIVSIRAGESVFIDFLKKDGIELEASMEASYSITDNLGAIVDSGVLTKTVDNLTFELRVAKTATAALADGDYELLVLVFDDTTGYGDYIFEETLRVYS